MKINREKVGEGGVQQWGGNIPGLKIVKHGRLETPEMTKTTRGKGVGKNRSSGQAPYQWGGRGC